MGKYIERLKLLLEEGRKFNYDNFCTKGDYGYPSSYKPNYMAWKTQVGNLLSSVFGKNSYLYETYIKHEEYKPLGNKRDKFDAFHNQILGSIEAAINSLDFEPIDEEKEEDNIARKNNKVFIVHGHDERLKQELEIFLNEIGLEPVVLHRQADEGQTIIEKFEKHSDVSYAFILLTPDEVAYLISEKEKKDDEREKELRARPNVIFEFGYFVAKLGRNRVCCLYKEGVTLPTDISGMIYKEINNSIEEKSFSILKDLKANGFIVTI